jgi:beta-lactam-binding protein with PASTA domain
VKRLLTILAVAVVFGGCGTDLGDAPNVEGLALPDAKEQLKQAGYEASVKSNAMFGVIVESNYTVCKEHTPSGKLVPLDVSKSC